MQFFGVARPNIWSHKSLAMICDVLLPAQIILFRPEVFSLLISFWENILKDLLNTGLLFTMCGLCILFPVTGFYSGTGKLSGIRKAQILYGHAGCIYGADLKNRRFFTHIFQRTADNSLQKSFKTSRCHPLSVNHFPIPQPINALVCPSSAWREEIPYHRPSRFFHPHLNQQCLPAVSGYVKYSLGAFGQSAIGRIMVHKTETAFTPCLPSQPLNKPKHLSLQKHSGACDHNP